jgi:16S rRNA (guanine(1405)-N(7))-methyltransferase
MNAQDELQRLVDAVTASPRYAAISLELVRSVGARELQKRRNFKEAVKHTRSKLHQVGVAYQEGGMDYASWQLELSHLPADMSSVELRDYCLRVMAAHASTRERLPILELFYQEIFSQLPTVQSILDVACGLNPLCLPWMRLEKSTRYYACDIYEDMVGFVNYFLAFVGVSGGAEIRDLTARIPEVEVDLALVLKTLPCLEQLDKSVTPRLLQGLRAKFILVSFPAQSLGGRAKGMPQFYEAQFLKQVENLPFRVSTLSFKTELAFLLERVAPED